MPAVLSQQSCYVISGHMSESHVFAIQTETCVLHPLPWFFISLTYACLAGEKRSQPVHGQGLYLTLPCADRGLFLSSVRDTVGDTWGTVKWLYVICLKNSSCHFEIQFPVRCPFWAFSLSSSEGGLATSLHTSLESPFQVARYPWARTLGWLQSSKSRASLWRK